MGYQDEDELSEEGFLEMLADYEKLSKLQEQYRELPHSPQRVELCREAVAVADRLEEPSEQLAGRFDLAYACIFGDDPAKALPVCAEFMRLHQENPGELGEAEGDAVISVAMLAGSIARRLRSPWSSAKACWRSSGIRSGPTAWASGCGSATPGNLP